MSSPSRPLLAAAATAGLLIVVWASVTGPATVFDSAGEPRTPGEEPSPSESPTREIDLPPSGEELFGDRPARLDLSWIGDLLAWAVLLGLIAVSGVVLRWLWLHRWRGRPVGPVEPDFEVLPPVPAATEALARDAEARLSALGEGTARDGIVHCWLRLEQVVADAGFPRERWETSSEFTVRVLHRLDVDPRSIATLAGLYREARFSVHPLDETARQRAAAALHRFQADLVEVDQ